jgi:hypothetical protein
MNHEPTALAFCQATGTAPEALNAAWLHFSAARARLRGVLIWTLPPDPHHVSLGDRPLVVCDIDEVVLEFLSPFTAFLRSHNYDLLPRSFRLHGNIVSLLDGSEMDKEQVYAFEDVFFANQHLWQKPAERAVETLHALSADADVVFLTAMPPPAPRRPAKASRPSSTSSFDMIASEEPKGPIVAKLHNRRDLPVAFVAEPRPYRLRRLLRHDREARRSRLLDKPVIIGGGKRGVVSTCLLHRPHLWRALGHADVQGAGGLPRGRGGQAEHGEICRGRPRGQAP